MQIEKNMLAKKNYIKLNLDNNQCINISKKTEKLKNIPEKARDSFFVCLINKFSYNSTNIYKRDNTSI